VRELKKEEGAIAEIDIKHEVRDKEDVEQGGKDNRITGI